MFFNKDEQSIKKLVKYWLNSLSDADRMGLSDELFKTSDQYCTASHSELANGQLNPLQVQKLFQIQQNSQEKTERQSISSPIPKTTQLLQSNQTQATIHLEILIDSQSDHQVLNEEVKENFFPPREIDSGLQILICPILLTKKLDGNTKIAPLLIPALLLSDGTLIANEENLPWVSR